MIILTGIAWVSLSIYVLYVLLFCVGLYRLKRQPCVPSVANAPNVSVVIAARNESNNLKKLLSDLASQKYPKDKLEIIIVDDRSTDGTWNIIKDFTKQYLNIKGLQITKKSKDMTPKKFALSRGISKARGDIILSTDGDCRVRSTWVGSMVEHLGSRFGIIAGFSAIHSEEQKLFHKYQHIDFLSLMSANAGAMSLGLSWAGSGQNIAYRKDCYEQVDGFNPVAHKISGDDIYLIQSISKISGGAFNPDPNGAVTTLPVDTLGQFINQRTRWASNASDQYNTKIWFLVFLLVAFTLNFSILFQVVLGFFSFSLLTIIFIKILSEGLVIFSGAAKLNTPVSISIFLLWSIIQTVYIPTVALLGISGKFNWKP